MTAASTAAGAAGATSVMGGAERRVVVVYAAILGALLLGYMFLGRGFAHIGVGPVYIGDAVLLIGIAVAGFVALRRGIPPVTWTLVLVLLFALLGAARTAPFLTTYQMAALRDGVLWGYAAFAVIVYVIADRVLVHRTFRAYGWIVPTFALWLPISWNLFRTFSEEIDPNRPAAVVPLVFFKGGDMAVHIVGAMGVLVLTAGPALSRRGFVWRTAVFLPLLWTIFVAGTSNRGALLTAIVGIVGLLLVAPRSRTWLAFLTAVALGLFAVAAQAALPGIWQTLAQPSASSGVGSASPTPSPTAVPSPTIAPGRDLPTSVPNGSFESGPTDGPAIEGWEVGPLGTYAVVVGDAREGRRYASITNVAEPHQSTLTSGPFALERGLDLAVSFHAIAIDGEARVDAYVLWYAGDELIGNEYITRSGGASEWTRASGALEPPTGAEHGRIQLWEATGDGATVGIDAVSIDFGRYIGPFVPLHDDDLPTAIPNGSFESGPLEAGVIEDWELGSSGAYNAVMGDAPDGRRFAVVQNPGDAHQAVMTSSRFRLEPRRELTVSLATMAVEGEPRIEAFVLWYDGQELMDAEVLDSWPTNGIQRWQRVTRSLEPREGATTARIQLWEATGDATVAIDDVSIDFDRVIAAPVVPEGRPATFDQVIENLSSIFGGSSDPGLEGTREFRLAWWGTIIEYTVFGDHFWTGKGFGINLADADGFQSTADGSLRAPHNSHLTVLARMGVPGFVLWLLLLGAFGLGMARSMLADRRTGDSRLAMIGAWVLVYWVAMIVNTSFDPYIEGPQGGIWFWALMGLGMTYMSLDRRQKP